jgi:hypothetical protein
MHDYNPFQDRGPVNPKLFVGRNYELTQLELALRQTTHGKQEHFATRSPYYSQ